MILTGTKGEEESGMGCEVSASRHTLCDHISARSAAARMDSAGVTGTPLHS